MQHTTSTEPLGLMLKSIALQKRTGLLKVERLGEKHVERGEIYFEGGRPISANTTRITGEDAFRYISSWQQVTCSFESMISRLFIRQREGQMTAEDQETGKAVQVRISPITTHLHRDLLSSPLPHPTTIRQTGPIDQQNIPTLPMRKHRQLLASNEHGTSASDTFTSLSSVSGQTQLPRTPFPVAHSVHGNESMSANDSMSEDSRTQPAIRPGKRHEATPNEPQKKPDYHSGHISKQSRVTQTKALHPTGTRVPLPEPAATSLPTLPAPNEEAFQPGWDGIFKVRSMMSTVQNIQQMGRRERIIYVLLDGNRTIHEIALLTHRSEAEIEQTLIELTQRGFVEYVGLQQRLPDVQEKMARLFRNQM